MSRPALSIIIPVFNKWELTAQCLQSLREHTPGEEYEVIVVDNASSDETPAQLPDLGRSLFGERFTRIRFEENRNFAGGCNAGAREAQAPLLFFLNNDTLLTPHWLPPLMNRLSSDPGLGMVGPLLLYEDDRVQHLGVAVNINGFSHLYRSFPKDHPVVGRPRFLQALTAAALMVPKELFHEAGAFYEEYKNGFEDVELSLRVRQLGKTLAYVPDSVIYHLESQTPGRGAFEDENLRLIMQRCWDAFIPDMHLHGRADGFAPVVDTYGLITLELPREKSQELRELSQNMTALERLALLKKEPLWRQGYDLAAGAFEREGKPRQALFVRIEAANFFNIPAEVRKLPRLARSCGEDSIAAYAEEALAQYQDPEINQGRLLHYQARAKLHNDQWLMAEYEKLLAAGKKKP